MKEPCPIEPYNEYSDIENRSGGNMHNPYKQVQVANAFGKKLERL